VAGAISLAEPFFPTEMALTSYGINQLAAHRPIVNLRFPAISVHHHRISRATTNSMARRGVIVEHVGRMAATVSAVAIFVAAHLVSRARLRRGIVSLMSAVTASCRCSCESPLHGESYSTLSRPAERRSKLQTNLKAFTQPR